ncbi:MAG: hypothetical protein ACJ749_07790 [Flavisolibacter sp.]
MELSLPEETLFYTRKERELNERLKRLLDEYELDDLEVDIELLDEEEDV